MLGTIQVELAGHVLVPNKDDGGVNGELVTIARLRCSRAAAENLHRAIGKALEMHDRVQQQPIASAGKLN
jgi:ribosomal protein L18E